VQAVAKSGMTVVAALDALSPSAYAHLDRVAVLLQGRLVYHGSTGA
jgi:ABC-type phosphate/phosphonate transport system ATPase subunit